MQEQVTSPQNRKPFALLILVMISPLLMGALCFGTGPTSSPLKAPGGMPSIGAFGENAINHLKMFDANNGWATTNDAVMRTSDGGKTWVDVTPTDWEPLDQSKPNIQGIISVCFLDANHAWVAVNENMSQADIDALATAQSNIAGSPIPTVGSRRDANIDTSHIPTIGINVYVRSTVDGGKTWMTSNFLSVDNLAGASEMNFFNQHEGWMELGTEVMASGTYVGALYHSTDGGVTWNTVEVMPGAPVSVISAQSAITGMTVVQYAPCPPDSQGPRSYSSCAQDDGSTVQGCTITPNQAQSQSILGWAGAVNAGHTLLTNTSDGANWTQDYTSALLTPGGAPRQNNDSSFVSSPPSIFGDGSGILPVEIQADPDGDDPSHFFLHLFTIAINSSTNSYTIKDAGPTSDFDTQLISGKHTLSAPDAQHVFVVGQEYNANDNTDGNVHLYEFVNGGWQKLKTQLDGTMPKSSSGDQAELFNAYLANLYFISDTEGWATNGTSLYHVTINAGSATWSLVSTATTNEKNLTDTSLAAERFTLIKREPGKLIPAPKNPPPCYNQETTNKQNPSNASGLPAHTLTGYWQNFTNGAKPLRLTDINASYDLIAVAFASADPSKPGGVTFSVDPDLARALGGYSDAQFISDITSLHQQGKKVILSVGGQNGSISVASEEAAKNFANSVHDLMKKYGFDGVDIDLENGLNVTYMASALQQLSGLVKSDQKGVWGDPQAGSSVPNLIITLAPQTVDMQSTQASYFQLALKIKDILTIVNMQYYNSGTMNGCDGKVYAQGSVDFLAAQACIQAQGGLSPGQIGLGLPASTSAAGSGYVEPSVVKSAISCLSSGQSCGSFKPSNTYAIQDVMTWSINWDASNNYHFAKTVKGG